MPNHWMDEIIKLYDKYYQEYFTHKRNYDNSIAQNESRLNQEQLIKAVEKVMINYKDEFKKYDDALTADMVEMEGYGQD